MKLVVTIDVEEEGLFQGSYPSNDASTGNVRSLEKLDPVFKKHGIRPTLLVAHAVAENPAHRSFLSILRDKWNAEIGAHLHPWNTPPIAPLPHSEPVPSDLIPSDILAAKLDTLIESVARIGGPPVSFRMGRFNMGRRMFSVVEASGLRVDSSIAPTRRQYGGPAHLCAPTDPYYPDSGDLSVPGESNVLEVPMTIVPITRNMGRYLQWIKDRNLAPQSAVGWLSSRVGSLPAQPMWAPLNVLKAAVRLHRRRAGQVITTFFHSSELMPGGCPKHQTDGDVNRFLLKLDRFLSWLRTECSAESMTLADLGSLYGGSSPSAKGNGMHVPSIVKQ